MQKKLFYQVGNKKVQLAITENEQLVEVYFEEIKESPLVGRIYRGKVVNVLPGMQAAFVDIGLEKNAFLYVDDAIAADIDRGEEFKSPSISEVVQPGQEIMVQIMKEPNKSKGARITTHITLPGRYVVFMPGMDHVGISRKIESEQERERLKEIGEDVKPENSGLIIRTVAEGKRTAELTWDIDCLVEQWEKIRREYDKLSAPALVHHDLELEERIVRDFFSENVVQIITNEEAGYQKILSQVARIHSKPKQILVLDKREDLFSAYGLDKELEKALKSKVWLNSGGYLIFEQTEAMLVVDVNTGKYVGKTNLEETVLKINLEAVDEIAQQLRVRNIGGIIVIDFIDMGLEANRQLLLDKLSEEVKKDQMKVTIIGQTPLGLVELTRKKIRPSIEAMLLQSCPHCGGEGKLVADGIDNI